MRTGTGANALLKLKNFIYPLGYADYSWKKIFSNIDPSYGEMSREKIISHYFSTSNRDAIKIGLETVKSMYTKALSDKNILEKFKTVCNAFGIDYEELI